MWRGKQSREKLRKVIADMMLQNQRSKLSRESRKQSRKSLRNLLRLPSRRRSMSDVSHNSDDTSGSKSGPSPDDASVYSFFKKKKNRPSGGESRTNSKSPVDLDDRSGCREEEEEEEEYCEDKSADSPPPPVQQLEFSGKRPVSMQSMNSEADEGGELGTKQSSWLAPLRGGFKRPSSFRREDSAVSGISAITKSSWESAVDRHLHKQVSMSSVKEHETYDGDTALDTAVPNQDKRRPFSIFNRRQDSNLQWPVQEVTSSRTLLEHMRKENKDAKSPGEERQLRRSATFNASTVVSLAHFVGMSPPRMDSTDTDDDPPDATEERERRKSVKRHTIAATDRSLFSHRTPRQRLEDSPSYKQRRKTISRMNSSDSSGGGFDSPKGSSRRQLSTRSLQHDLSVRSIDFSVGQRSIESKHSAESSHNSGGAQSGGEVSHPSADASLASGANVSMVSALTAPSQSSISTPVIVAPGEIEGVEGHS
jgi:hypothetical protein